jgi:hypothetical protein
MGTPLVATPVLGIASTPRLSAESRENEGYPGAIFAHYPQIASRLFHVGAPSGAVQ